MRHEFYTYIMSDFYAYISTILVHNLWQNLHKNCPINTLISPSICLMICPY